MQSTPCSSPHLLLSICQSLPFAAPDWGALEGEALAPQRYPALQLNLQAQRQGGTADGGVLVTFDDDQQQQQQQQAGQAGQARWQPPAQQGQVTLSDVWESADGGMDFWMDREEGGSYQQQQQQQQQPAQRAAPHVPTFAPRPGRQQLALAHSQPKLDQAGFVDEGIEDEDWDEGMLQQVRCVCLVGALDHCACELTAPVSAVYLFCLLAAASLYCISDGTAT